MSASTHLAGLLACYRQELLQLQHLREETYRIYHSCLVQFFEFCQCELQTDPLTCCGTDMLNCLSVLKERGISNASLGHYRWSLRSFYAFLKKTGVRRDDPAQYLFRIKKHPSDRNRPVATEEIIKLLKAIDTSDYQGQRDALMIAILWTLGLRISELLKMRVQDIKVIDPKEKTALLTIHGKGRKQRALFVVDKLFEHFSAYLAHPQTPKDKAHLLFPGKNGAPTHDSTILRRLQRYGQAAGLTCRISPHVLRHSFATEMYHQGVPVEAIQTMLGHRCLDESAIYIHISDHKKQQALSLLAIGGS